MDSVSTIKDILNDNNKVVHPCKCISVNSNMVAYKHCKLHNNIDRNENVVEKVSTKKYDNFGRIVKSTVVTDYNYDLNVSYMPEENASNLRLYTILGLILG